MKTEYPNFTAEELFYIEKIMDINASIGMEKMSKMIETFIFSRSNEKYSELLASGILEYGEAQAITKSIRNKIEEWRRGISK